MRNVKQGRRLPREFMQSSYIQVFKTQLTSKLTLHWAGGWSRDLLRSLPTCIILLKTNKQAGGAIIWFSILMKAPNSEGFSDTGPLFGSHTFTCKILQIHLLLHHLLFAPSWPVCSRAMLLRSEILHAEKGFHAWTVELGSTGWGNTQIHTGVQPGVSKKLDNKWIATN